MKCIYFSYLKLLGSYHYFLSSHPFKRLTTGQAILRVLKLCKLKNKKDNKQITSNSMIILSYFIILVNMPVSGFAITVDLNNNYWQCKTHDAINVYWESKNLYQKIALNFSYAKCKKNSTIPTTCRTSKTDCERFIAGMNVTPMWECTAFDKDAFVWKSNHYLHREDAALAAKAYCKQKSPIPDTCYINLITCLNKQAS